MDTLDLRDPRVAAHLAELDAHATANIQNLFVQRNPEVMHVPLAERRQIGEAIEQRLTAEGLLYNVENLERVYLALKAEGAVYVPESNEFHPDTLAVLQQLPTDEMRRRLEAMQPPRPENMAKYLPTSGLRSDLQPAVDEARERMLAQLRGAK